MMIKNENIKRNIEEILSRIRALNSGVKLLAVSKTFDKADVMAAIEAGLNEFGESKIQEAMEKIPGIKEAHPEIKWHLIGHLQSNKVSKAVKLFDCIQSIDSLKLAEKVSASAEPGKPVEALLEIKVSGEETKYGILPEETEAAVTAISRLQGIRIRGLMTMAPYSEDPENARPYFRKARELFDLLKKSPAPNVSMDILSMGMSDDYIVAVEEGSTMVRIGSAIFGKRNY